VIPKALLALHLKFFRKQQLLKIPTEIFHARLLGDIPPVEGSLYHGHRDFLSIFFWNFKTALLIRDGEKGILEDQNMGKHLRAQSRMRSIGLFLKT